MNTTPMRPPRQPKTGGTVISMSAGRAKLRTRTKLGRRAALREAIEALRKSEPWPQFGPVPDGCESTARDAFNAAIDQVLEILP